MAHLDPCDVEHLVDEPEQVPARPQDVRDRFFLRWRQLVHLEQLGEPENGVERGTELVAHPREELALGLTRLLCGGDRQEQLLLGLDVTGDVA